MRTAVLIGSLCLVVSLVYVRSEDANTALDDVLGDESPFDSPDIYDKRAFRSRFLCMRWNYPCVKGSRRQFARCCRDLQCSCPAYGGNCKCVSMMGR